MSARRCVTAADLEAYWLSDHAVGMVHDHQAQDVVVQMADGTEYACTFAAHARHLARRGDS